MKTSLREAMTAGVLVEFCNAQGDLVAQAVFSDWRGRPLPAVGDWLTCAARNSVSGRTGQVRGCVTQRAFDLQHDEQGLPCVWVRLQVSTQPRAVPRRRMRPAFSLN